MGDVKQFIYQDARGNVTARTVGGISETEDYIQGVCQNAKALRTFRRDRILEFVTSSNIDERLVYHIENCPAFEERTVSSRKINKNGQPEICFTGFKSDSKKALAQIAEEAGMFIRSSVTVNLSFLCCGDNAGPKKIEKARYQGVIALNENQFKWMLETGEIPEA